MERLTLFQIGVPGAAANATNALYANGNHQCKVVIRILKETSADGSSWQAAPLSENERSSLTVLPYSNDRRPVQAEGWYCDVNANQYTHGLWRRDASPETTASAATTEVETISAAEQFYRYMRFNAREASKKPAQFMACVTLDDGTQYSTSMDNGSVAFASSVTVAPQDCNGLRVQDLTLNVQRAYAGASGSADVDVYYWTLPNGLRVVEESFSGEGNSNAQLVYAYAMRADNKFRMGAAIRRGVTYLYLGQIDGDIFPQDQDKGFSVTNSDSMLRAARYQCQAGNTMNGSDYDNSLYWTITDNYGCLSTFILRANSADKGATLRLFNKDPQPVMREFQIGIVGTTASATDALYANGRQQCRLVIKVLKGVPYNDGASWDPVPLSEREKESLTVLPYSNELRPPQAWGWYCDDKPNQYQEGLRPGAASVEQAGAADEQPSAVNTTGEQIYRYMRCNGGQAPIQPQKFMACITLDDGTQYSTHMDNADAVFESSITISPQEPYGLRVQDLTLNVQRAYGGVVDRLTWMSITGPCPMD